MENRERMVPRFQPESSTGKGVEPPEFDAVDVRRLLKHIGEDPNRQGLQETPQRFLKAWEFWTSGYDTDPASVLKSFEDGAEGCDELVFQSSISLWSLCEHHMAPFFGVAHIAYLPDKRVVGLSKLSRLVEVFARRLQVQERLCNQIADALMEHLQPKGAGVVLECRHSCIESRGVQKAGSITTTTAIRGAIKEHADLRQEFTSLVRTASSRTAI